MGLVMSLSPDFPADDDPREMLGRWVAWAHLLATDGLSRGTIDRLVSENHYKELILYRCRLALMALHSARF
jgi:hypothetical protein